MREIKFRIWNGESIEETIIDFNIDKDSKYKEFYIYPDDVFMQFTGLKDKNGVEIYEGDILNHDGSLGCVSYINSGNCNVLGYVLSSLINNRIFYMFCDEADDYEIIGNIYENPELLRED